MSASRPLVTREELAKMRRLHLPLGEGRDLEITYCGLCTNWTEYELMFVSNGEAAVIRLPLDTELTRETLLQAADYAFNTRWTTK